MKSNYLKLPKDRDKVIKFANDKENEVDDLYLQLSMAHYSLYKAENQISVAPTHKEDCLNSKTKEIIQIIEEMNIICENKSGHSISTFSY